MYVCMYVCMYMKGACNFFQVADQIFLTAPPKPVLKWPLPNKQF